MKDHTTAGGILDLEVCPDGAEPYRVTAAARDVLNWERTSRTNASFADLAQAPRLVELYRLAWIVARRLGLYSGELTAFEETCDVLPYAPDEETDDEPDPTAPAATPGPASGSPSTPASRRPSGRKRATGR